MPSDHISYSGEIQKQLLPLAEFVFLMGSVETPRFHSESDVDIAVFWKDLVSQEQMHTIHSELEAALKRDVDLISLKNVDLIFGRQLLETGRLLFCNSPGILMQWKLWQMGAYPDFKTSRKIIEDRILTRKKYV